MTRVLSGAVLILFVTGLVWLAPPAAFLAFAVGVVSIGAWELVGLARAGGLNVPLWLSMTGALTTLVTFGLAGSPGGPGLHGPPGPPGTPLTVVLMVQVVAILGASMAVWSPGNKDALATASASLFPSWYLALPMGALVSIRVSEGPAPLFLLMLTVMVSDTAQYYTGRLAGRRPLAPAISPKKTIEGAAGGLVFGTLAFAVVGAWWLGRLPIAFRALVGLTIVLAGIAGDLFESMLKRSAGVKDSSAIIPGHGGVLDRIDALLFAAPVYYVVLQYV